MTTQHRISSLALALAAFAVACADPTATARPIISSNVPSLDASTIDRGFPPPAGLTGGQVRLCKTTPAGDAGQAWSFTVTAVGEIGANPPAPPSPVVINGVSGATVCTLVFTSGKNGLSLDRVTIVEQALPANWALTHIHIDQYDDGPGYNPPAPGMTDNGNLATRTATIFINADMERIATFTNDFTAPPPTGNEGCTPGYWKQDQHFDSYPAGYAPGMSFNLALGLANPNALYGTGVTILSALSTGGGGAAALGRHAAAAILNAASGFYPLTVAQVKALVASAVANPALIESVKDQLAALNELGCPLN